MLWRQNNGESQGCPSAPRAGKQGWLQADLHCNISVGSRWPLSAGAVLFWHQVPSAYAPSYFQVDLASGRGPGFLQSEESAPVVSDELSAGTWCGTNLLLCSSGKFQLSIKISLSKSDLSSLLSGTSELCNTEQLSYVLRDIKYYYFPQIFQQNWWRFDELIQYFNFAGHLVQSQTASSTHVNQLLFHNTWNNYVRNKNKIVINDSPNPRKRGLRRKYSFLVFCIFLFYHSSLFSPLILIFDYFEKHVNCNKFCYITSFRTSDAQKLTDTSLFLLKYGKIKKTL